MVSHSLPLTVKPPDLPYLTVASQARVPLTSILMFVAPSCLLPLATDKVRNQPDIGKK